MSEEDVRGVSVDQGTLGWTLCVDALLGVCALSYLEASSDRMLSDHTAAASLPRLRLQLLLAGRNGRAQL